MREPAESGGEDEESDEDNVCRTVCYLYRFAAFKPSLIYLWPRMQMMMDSEATSDSDSDEDMRVGARPRMRQRRMGQCVSLIQRLCETLISFVCWSLPHHRLTGVVYVHVLCSLVLLMY